MCCWEQSYPGLVDPTVVTYTDATVESTIYHTDVVIVGKQSRLFIILMYICRSACRAEL